MEEDDAQHIRVQENYTMSKITELFRKITAMFSPYIEEETEPEERAVAWQHMYEQVWTASRDSDSEVYLYEMYTDDNGGTYAIGTSEGRLFRAGVTVADGEASIGEWSPVQIQHVPVNRGLSVVRQADGRYRWAGISCTAILNKDSEIDSTTLFDRFVEHFAERSRENDPVVLDFYHHDIFLGEVDYVARDGYTFITSGLFNDDDLGRAAAQGLEADPEYWGQSIFYKPSAVPSLVTVGDDIQFPVWEDGELLRVALLPRDRASAWFTTINTRSMDMDQKVKDALRRLIGDDKADALADQSDEVNARVEKGDVIARETQVQVTEPVVAEAEPVPDAEPVAPDLSEAPPDVTVIREMRTQQAEVMAVLETLTLTMDAFVGDVKSRLSGLEMSEQKRRDAWVSDLPAVANRTVVRPRVVVRGAEDEVEEVDMNAHVNALLLSKGITPG